MKKILSKIYYDNIYGTALDYRIRKYIIGEYIAELKPFSQYASVSDLFVWRENPEWETEFEIFNITSFIFPDDPKDEKCNIIVFNEGGNIINKSHLLLHPYERKTLKLSDYLNGHSGIGTFSVFHHSSLAYRFAERKSHLTERGYIGYKRRGEELKSYCHGNLQSLSQSPNQLDFSFVPATTAAMRYHPQLTLSDTDKFELIYTNPSRRKRDLLVNFYDKDGNFLYKMEASIPSCGVKVIESFNNDRRIHTFDNVGNIVMWRPLIIKYYETHFDVMHG